LLWTYGFYYYFYKNKTKLLVVLREPVAKLRLRIKSLPQKQGRQKIRIKTSALQATGKSLLCTKPTFALA
jgi:hypothetical protein